MFIKKIFVIFLLLTMINLQNVKVVFGQTPAADSDRPISQHEPKTRTSKEIELPGGNGGSMLWIIVGAVAAVGGIAAIAGGSSSGGDGGDGGDSATTGNYGISW